MAGLKTAYLKASLLPEALAAMIVIMISVGIGASVYGNVLGSDNGSQKLRAELLLDKMALDATQNNRMLNEEIKMNEFTIRKTVMAYAGAEKLYQLKLVALNEQGKTVAEHSELTKQALTR
jgi:hypothetical protein